MSPSILQLAESLNTMHGLADIPPPRGCALTSDGGANIYGSSIRMHGNR